MKSHHNTTTPDTHPHVVIIGAGFGGLQAALALGKKQPALQMTVIDRTNHHLFQPLLYQVATAALSPADISTPIRHVLRKQKNTVVIMSEVTGIDVEQKRVIMHHGSITYDYLIVATGAHENYFGHIESWKPLAPGLKNLEDAQEVRRKLLVAFEQAEIETDPERIQQLLTFAVVGGGPTGVELAGAIAELAFKTLIPEFRHIDPTMIHILLIEALPQILGAFPAELSNKAKRELQKLGVDLRLNTPVEEITTDGVIARDEWIPASTVIWTAGVQASEAGKWLNTETDRAGRVKVLPDLTLPAHPEIFVLGDTATLMQDGKPLPGVAPVAMQQGRYVASVIEQRLANQQPGAPFRYHDKGYMATVGRAFAIVRIGKIRSAGFLAWLLWLTVHIIYLIGYENRLIVLLQWSWSYLSFQRRVRIITRSAWLALSRKKKAESGKHGGPR
ncbi:NAD(P)/FAD-dependent oxidoreductase [Dictyobacter formicarum]|uniref:NADH:ubiquinone reductase (non-electrogenic) n=1 Tax=Dictyobacter formicarum TaxID=2778368 RepID=A0ABQ3VF65_9CHLR|nr:NAD(P)/FAD-dependent oxidoreductase [Dictyobacter formicarum]GHO84463.1 NADH dehydrogenase [Dictyobacter formicarum]